MEKYRILGKKGEGTFSEVLKCQNVRDGTFWAAKKMKQLYKSMDEVQQIREIRVLKQLNGHPNVVFLREIIFDKRTGTLCLIFELMAMNLYEYIRARQRLLSNETVCQFVYQLLKALEYLHRHGYFHRDIKPENILIKNNILKLADFGSCRQISSKPPLTEYISTRWYRAPECLLTDGFYRNPMDMWSAGCVMYEAITLRPLFPGSNELDQISRIHDILGTPSTSTLDKFQHRNSQVDFNFPSQRGTGIARHLTQSSPDAIDLINKLCVYDPDHRLSAAQALRHPYFDEIRNEENQRSQETKNYAWDNDIRVAKTSEERLRRSDSSSSQSSLDEPHTSPRSNVHHKATKPDYTRLIRPAVKAQSLIDTRVQGQSHKNPSNQHKHNTKIKLTHSDDHHSQAYHTTLSATDPHGVNYQSPTSKTGPQSFLPRISGASAFSDYSTNTGYASTINTKNNNYASKNAISYYPMMSHRSYKK